MRLMNSSKILPLEDAFICRMLPLSYIVSRPVSNVSTRENYTNHCSNSAKNEGDVPIVPSCFPDRPFTGFPDHTLFPSLMQDARRVIKHASSCTRRGSSTIVCFRCLQGYVSSNPLVWTFPPNTLLST